MATNTDTCSILVHPVSEETDLFESRNPWPYMEEYFDFIGIKGKNLEFKCLLCTDKEKILSVSNKSSFNLKLHIGRSHPFESEQFQSLIANATQAVRKRKRGELPNFKIPLSDIDQYIVEFFIENMIPLQVRNFVLYVV